VGHLSANERVALFRRSARRSPTDRAETNAAVLSAAAAVALAEQLSIQISESDFSVACVAAPIRDRAGACIATISIVLREPKATQAQDRYANAVRAAAARMEAALGWT
jgi:DNA-binding IclR family transcriptional regulator